MTLDQALRTLKPGLCLIRKGGPCVRLAVGAELATYHRYVSVDDDAICTFDATSADLAATDWEKREIVGVTGKAAETKSKKA